MERHCPPSQADCTVASDKTLLLAFLSAGNPAWGLAPAPDLGFVNRAVGSALRAFLAQALTSSHTPCTKTTYP